MSHPNKFVKIVSPLALAIALAACGGGDPTFGGGGSAGGGGTGGGEQVVKTSSIELSASSRQLSSDGAKPVVITAIAKDKNNNAINGASIVFSVNSDATINTEAEGDTAGGSVQIANLTPSIPKNRTLEITATSGKESKTIFVDVVGTTVVVDGPDTITLNKDVPFVLKLQDSANKPISFEPVELTSSAGNTIKTDSNLQTNAIGEIEFTMLGLAAGSDTLNVKVLGVEYSKNVEVSGDEFVLDTSLKEININTNQQINFVWTKEGVPQANKQVTISATRGDIDNASVVTDANGKASFTITSTTAGQTVITATAVGGVSTSIIKEFVATTPAYLNTQADPTLVAPNKSSKIIAKIRDINDNPVKNKTIDFRLSDTVDGKLSASTAVTDSLGRASVSYTAGNSSSSKDGVVIKTFILGYPAVETDTVKLTVGGNALRITLGHDQLVAVDDVFYKKQFGVIVTDSAGNPVTAQNVSFKIIPKSYYKGRMEYNPTAEEWFQTITAKCDSEDFDNDGSLDAGEDINNNGKLEPTHDAAVTGSGVTDEQGKIVVEVIYPKNTAWWVDQDIEATIIVDGTEFIEHTIFTLPVLAADVEGKGTPPNVISPYGIGFCETSPDELPDLPPVMRVIDPQNGFAASPVSPNNWYSITQDGIVVNPNGVIKKDPSAGIKFEYGPNNTFRVVDEKPLEDDSGFFIHVEIEGKKTFFYYNDYSAGRDAPIITLNGEGTMTVAKDSVFIDEGANAVDSNDDVLTVTTFGNVDTSKPGVYTLIYQAGDKFANIATVTRTVTVSP